MNENHDHSSFENGDDQELLDAIAATFGSDAVGMLGSSWTPDGDDTDSELVDVVRAIDQNIIHSADQILPTETSTPPQVLANSRYIVVQLGRTTLGIPLENVQEIQRTPGITSLPRVPDWVLGVTNLRGNVVSVVDLKRFLGTPANDVVGPVQRVVMTHSLVDDVDTGFLVDQVVGIRSFTEDTILPPTAPFHARIGQHLSGIVESNGDLIGLLDIDRLLLSTEFRQFEAA